MRKSILLFVLALVVAACGGDSGNGGADGGDGGDGGDGDRSVAACDLLSADEAAQWLGGSPVDAGPSDAPGSQDETCSYRNDEAAMQILLQVRDGEQYFAGPDSGARGPDDVDGIGEDGHTDGSYVAFLANGFSVRVSQIQGPVTYEDLEEIAKLIESRLPG